MRIGIGWIERDGVAAELAIVTSSEFPLRTSTSACILRSLGQSPNEELGRWSMRNLDTGIFRPRVGERPATHKTVILLEMLAGRESNTRYADFQSFSGVEGLIKQNLP
jgi:hypothetical protein